MKDVSFHFPGREDRASKRANERAWGEQKIEGSGEGVSKKKGGEGEGG